MAFEVFDDVAFYWFLQVLLGIVLIPWTFYKVKTWLFSKRRHITRSHPYVKNIPDYIPSIKLVEDEIDNRLSLTNIFFWILWVLYILLLIQLPKWHNRQMTNFDPFEILGLPRDATEAVIKRTYRKLSFKYHPDKNPDNPKARDLFILVQKAYETLTDPTTKDNWSKFGNPDGYQGTMVTIGLPSWLTHSNNELIILICYFGIFFVFVLIVYFWWTYTARFHKTGVYKRTIDIYWKFTKQNMALVELLDILCASVEYKLLDVKIPNDDNNIKNKDYLALSKQIKSIKSANIKMRGKQIRNEDLEGIFAQSYVKKAVTLLQAHLMGIPIPESLKDEFLFILQEAPRLLDVMIDMTLSREHCWAQGIQLIQLKQAIIQGVWPQESRLKQLPYWNPAIDEALRREGYDDIIKLTNLTDEELAKLFRNIFDKHTGNYSHLIRSDEKSDKEDDNDNKDKKDKDILPPGKPSLNKNEMDKMVYNVIAMVRMYPFVQMRYCARTYDEKEIYVGDLVTVTVELERFAEPWKLNKSNFRDVEPMQPPEQIRREERKKLRKSKLDNNNNNNNNNDNDNDNKKDNDDDNNNNNNNNNDAKAKKSAGNSKNVKKTKYDNSDDVQYSEEDGLEFVDTSLDEEQRLQIERLNAPVVHVTRFPFRVKEKWMIMLVDKNIPAVIDQRAIPALSGIKKIDLHFRVSPRPVGKHVYILLAKCDSYIGADKSIEFTLNIHNVERKVDDDDDDDQKDKQFNYEIPQEEEYQANPKWYYLWNETFGEFVLTLILIYFIYLVLASTSMGNKYIVPYVNLVWEFIAPFFNILGNYLYLALHPVMNQVKTYTKFDIEQWWYANETNATSPNDDDMFND